MKPKKAFSAQLIALGILFLGISIANLFIDVPEAVQGYFQRVRVTYQGLNSAASSPTEQPGGITTIASVPVQSPAREKVQRADLIVKPDSTPTPMIIRNSYIPDRIVSEVIGLDAPVIIAHSKSLELKDEWFEQWIAPDEFAAGWHDHSAPLGVPGNTVINGHHNEFGKVFGKLVYLQKGDLIQVYSGNKVFQYQVTETKVLNERDASLETRKLNAKWVSQTDDERLTLVTCWPKKTNTHRLIIVAYPVDGRDVSIPVANALP